MGNAPDALLCLIDRFDRNCRVFLSPDCKEEQLRAELLNGPTRAARHSGFVARTSSSLFFTALGWDMDFVKITTGRLGEARPLLALDKRLPPS
jgi:hypothetical protein